MIDLPPVLPDEYPAPPALVRKCANEAAAHYGLPPTLILAIIEVEGGKVGSVKSNTNGSYDLGIMQINTINLPQIEREFGIKWQDLAYKPCVNIAVGTWFLSSRIKAAPDLWTGVGNYHSATPKYHSLYLAKVTEIFMRKMSAASKSST